MTRIHQQVSSERCERWYRVGHSMWAGSKACDLCVRAHSFAGAVGDGAINQPAEWQRYRLVWRGCCRREDYFDRAGDRVAADYHQQRVRTLPVPGCASGRL